MQTVEKQINKGQDEQLADKPLYVTLKDYVRNRVEAGEWSVGQRVPSENELVELLGVSRMTANRALRELADEGFVIRVQGKGSFVASKKRTSQFQSVPNIADEITRSGGVHTANVIVLRMESCDSELAEALSVEIGSPVSHSVMVHAEDSVPMQVEDRFVNHDIVPHYIDQDFTRTTPNGYLTSVAPIIRAEQHIEAVTAQPWECKLLAISKTEPCLLVRRRTWSQAGVISSVRLLYPGSRYRLYST